MWRLESDGNFRLTVECPWRLELDDSILVGSEDYGTKADSNLDPDWDPTEIQSGHRQDEILARILGTEQNGTIVNTGNGFLVHATEADQFGGVTISLSGGYRLSLFPAGGYSDREAKLGQN